MPFRIGLQVLPQTPIPLVLLRVVSVRPIALLVTEDGDTPELVASRVIDVGGHEAVNLPMDRGDTVGHEPGVVTAGISKPRLIASLGHHSLAAADH